MATCNVSFGIRNHKKEQSTADIFRTGRMFGTKVEEAGLLPGRWRWSRPAVDGMDSARAVVSSQLPEYVPGRQVRAGLEIDLDLLLPEIIDPVGPESLFE